jgi:hypothetical protein
VRSGDCLVVASYSFSTRKLKADTKIKSRRGAGHSQGIRGCWFVLLFRTLPPAAPLASPVAPLRGIIGRVLFAAAVTRPAGPHTDILAPHTSGPKDVPRCGALSLLQKTPHYRGDPAEIAARLNVKLCDLVVVVTYCF